MLTSNFVPYMYSCSSYDGTRRNRRPIVKDLNGTNYQTPNTVATNTWMYGFYPSDQDAYGGFWLELGNGNTPPTSGDYKMENKITELTPLAGDYIYNDTGAIRIYRSFANNTDHSIEVSEVGLAIRIQTDDGGKQILLAREVSASPITIEPNGIQTFGIDIGYNDDRI